MKTLSMLGRAGADAVLHLDVPVDAGDCEYQVTVVVEPFGSARREFPREWPPGFFEATCGRWVGEFEIESDDALEE